MSSVSMGFHSPQCGVNGVILYVDFGGYIFSNSIIYLWFTCSFVCFNKFILFKIQGLAEVGIQLFMWKIYNTRMNNIRINCFRIHTTISLLLPTPVYIFGLVIVWHVNIKSCLLAHQLNNVWIVDSFKCLQINLLWTFIAVFSIKMFFFHWINI